MKLKVGNMHDCELRPNDLEGTSSKYDYVYIFSIVVDSRHRFRGHAKMLIHAHISNMKSLFPDGKEMMVLADTVSKGGEAIARLYGLKVIKETSHRTKLYEGIVKI